MCNLLGPQLDGAVAHALSIQGIVLRPNGQPAFERHFDPDVHHHEAPYEGGFSKMYIHYNPSVDGQIAMSLQAEYNIAVYPDPDAAAVGTERWVAGFNWTIEQDENEYTFFAPISCMDHAARGTTPQIAICRAIVTAAKSPRSPIYEARMVRIRGIAHERAEHARRTRTPWTEFANDEERAAYAKAMDDARSFIVSRNPEVYGSKA